MDNLIKWFTDREGKVYYSMTYRNGQIVNGRPNYDCSSAVYYALISAGLLPAGHRIGNTDSLFGDLEKAGWVRTDRPQRGSIFIWGVRGASGGASGHTGVFKDNANIIHCASGYNGIHSDNHDWLWGINGRPAVTYYTYQGKPYDGDDDQDVSVGSTIRFDRTFTVNDVKLIGGLWQVRSDELCPVDFTWDDNGIPAEPLYEVDTEGYATPDQNLDPGSRFVIPGKFTVQDVGAYKGRWLALIQWNVYKFWVDLEHATEIKSSAPGKAVPQPKPAETPVTPQKPEEPVTEPPVKPEEPIVEEPVIEQPTPPKDNEDVPQKEDTMAFTKEQQKELLVQQENVLNANDDFSPVISEKVKTIAYFATDLGILVSVFVLTVMAVLNKIDGNTAIYLASAISALMVGIKQTFRLSSKKQ